MQSVIVEKGKATPDHRERERERERERTPDT